MTKTIIEQLDNLPIYICGHLKPDQDSICSSIALGLFLKELGKETYVLLADSDKDILDWKQDYSLIANKITHTNYNFIALDVNETKRLGEYEDAFYKANHTINIDHHQHNKYEAQHTISDTNASSTCELIYEIINNYSKDYFTKDICEYLYCGILNDTNCFSRRISNKTFLISQELINAGIDYVDIIKNTINQRSMYEYKALASAINDIQYDVLHYLVIDKNRPEYINLTHNQIVKKLAEDLRKIDAIDVFLVLIQENNKIICKCMSNISENANIIAELFGGGGHKKEAGFTVYDVTIEDILKTCKLYLQSNTSKKR